MEQPSFPEDHTSPEFLQAFLAWDGDQDDGPAHLSKEAQSYKVQQKMPREHLTRLAEDALVTGNMGKLVWLQHNLEYHHELLRKYYLAHPDVLPKDLCEVFWFMVGFQIVWFGDEHMQNWFYEKGNGIYNIIDELEKKGDAVRMRGYWQLFSCEIPDEKSLSTAREVIMVFCKSEGYPKIVWRMVVTGKLSYPNPEWWGRHGGKFRPEKNWWEVGINRFIVTSIRQGLNNETTVAKMKRFMKFVGRIYSAMELQLLQIDGKIYYGATTSRCGGSGMYFYLNLTRELKSWGYPENCCRIFRTGRAYYYLAASQPDVATEWEIQRQLSILDQERAREIQEEIINRRTNGEECDFFGRFY